jgi:hypothetical protein
VNVLKLVADGADRRAVIGTLLEEAEGEAMRPLGRRSSGYSYAVPGQWQGHVRKLRVVGAKAGEKATIGIGRDPRSVERLQRLVGAPVRLLHVTRNPFDMIARMALITKGDKPERTISGATEFTARLARINARIISERERDVLTVRHEAFVADPEGELSRIAAFLGLEPNEEWLSACSAVVFPQPHPTRERIEWTPEEREGVEQLIARHAFFEGYTWTST